MCSAPSVVVVAMLARDLLGTGAVLFVAVIAAPPRCCRGMCGTSKPRFIDNFNQRWGGVTLTSCMSVICYREASSPLATCSTGLVRVQAKADLDLASMFSLQGVAGPSVPWPLAQARSGVWTVQRG